MQLLHESCMIYHLSKISQSQTAPDAAVKLHQLQRAAAATAAEQVQHVARCHTQRRLTIRRSIIEFP